MPSRLWRSAKDDLVGIRTKVKSGGTLIGKGNLATIMIMTMMVVVVVVVVVMDDDDDDDT